MSRERQLLYSFVISRLDYCNSILYGLPKLEHDKLQRIQNIAARMITGTKRKEHITPTLKDLHWLPVKSLIIITLFNNNYFILVSMSSSAFALIGDTFQANWNLEMLVFEHRF